MALHRVYNDYRVIAFTVEFRIVTKSINSNNFFFFWKMYVKRVYFNFFIILTGNLVYSSIFHFIHL